MEGGIMEPAACAPRFFEFCMLLSVLFKFKAFPFIQEQLQLCTYYCPSGSVS